MCNDSRWMEEPDEEYATSNMEAAMMAYEFEQYMLENDQRTREVERMYEAADLRRKEIREGDRT